MNDEDDVWRGKTDEQVLLAYRQLDDFTEEGQRLLEAEVERRGLLPQVEHGPQSRNEAADALELEPESEFVAPRNPIARLWAGGYSLPVSYWLWGWLGSLIWGAAIVSFPVPTSDALALVGFGLALLYIVYGVIAMVGIWRSAGRYRGPAVWSTLARVSIAVGVARTVAGIVGTLLDPGV